MLFLHLYLSHYKDGCKLAAVNLLAPTSDTVILSFAVSMELASSTQKILIPIGQSSPLLHLFSFEHAILRISSAPQPPIALEIFLDYTTI